jgi:predicted nucleotidyltransferase
MIPGLTEAEWQPIHQLLIKHPAIQKVVLFGSRVKGNFSPGSDIDLAFYFEPTTSFSEWLNLQNVLDEVGPIQKIDALDFDKVRNPELREHIERVGKVVYEKGTLHHVLRLQTRTVLPFVFTLQMSEGVTPQTECTNSCRGIPRVR